MATTAWAAENSTGRPLSRSSASTTTSPSRWEIARVAVLKRTGRAICSAIRTEISWVPPVTRASWEPPSVSSSSSIEPAERT